MQLGDGQATNMMSHDSDVDLVDDDAGFHVQQDLLLDGLAEEFDQP